MNFYEIYFLIVFIILFQEGYKLYLDLNDVILNDIQISQHVQNSMYSVTLHLNVHYWIKKIM